jgi:hypothetical protein
MKRNSSIGPPVSGAGGGITFGSQDPEPVIGRKLYAARAHLLARDRVNQYVEATGRRDSLRGPTLMNPNSPQMQPAQVVDGFALLTDTYEKDTPWAVNRRIYENWRIFDPWPQGMLLHMAGPVGSDVRVQAVWTNEEDKDRHMAAIGIERFTDVVEALAREFETAPPDMVPISRKLRLIAFGSPAKHLVDIGPDLDESSGKQFGTAMTSADIDYSSLSGQEVEELTAGAGLGAELPAEMIMRAVWDGENGLEETQVWKSEAAAREFFEQHQAHFTDEIPVVFHEVVRLAIASSELGRELS